MFSTLATLVLFVQVNPIAWGTNQSDFVIHGVWPEYANDTWPSYCCTDSVCSFNETLIEDLVPELTQWWTNFHDPEDLWEHEWEKHGTCSEWDEYDYFSTGLGWRADYPMYDVLVEADLKPDVYYSFDEFKDALDDTIGFQTVITCTGDLLEQVELCYWDSKLGDCPDTIPNTCPDELYY